MDLPKSLIKVPNAQKCYKMKKGIKIHQIKVLCCVLRPFPQKNQALCGTETEMTPNSLLWDDATSLYINFVNVVFAKSRGTDVQNDYAKRIFSTKSRFFTKEKLQCMAI